MLIFAAHAEMGKFLLKRELVPVTFRHGTWNYTGLFNKKSLIKEHNFCIAMQRGHDLGPSENAM